MSIEKIILDKNYSSEENKKFREGLLKIRSKIDDCLKDENYSKGILMKYGFQDYFDFYFSTVGDFENILKKDEKLKKIFFNFSGKFLGRITRKDIYNFINYIGISEPNINSIKKYVFDFFIKNGLETQNLLISSNKETLVNNIYNDKKVLYLFKKLTKCKNIEHINSEKIYKVMNFIGLKKLSEKELLIFIKKYFFEIGIKNMNYLKNIDLKYFKENIFENSYVYAYFRSKGILKENLKKQDFLNLGEFFLTTQEDNNINNINNAKEFLNSKNIYLYDDLRKIGRLHEIRSFLWNNEYCLKVFKEMGFGNAKSFKVDYLKRFCRRIGIEGVPLDEETDIEKGRIFLIKILKNNGINDVFSLKLKGIKFFKNICSKKVSGNNFENVIGFLREHLSKGLNEIFLEDLTEIGKIIGLKEFTLEEQKENFLGFLSDNNFNLLNLDILTIKKSFIFSKSFFQYFLEKLNLPKNRTLFSEQDLQKFKDYFLK